MRSLWCLLFKYRAFMHYLEYRRSVFLKFFLALQTKHSDLSLLGRLWRFYSLPYNLSLLASVLR